MRDIVQVKTFSCHCFLNIERLCFMAELLSVAVGLVGDIIGGVPQSCRRDADSPG